MKAKKVFLISFNGKSIAGGVERVTYYLDEYFHSRNIETKIIDEDYLIHHTLFGRIFQQLFRFRHFKKRKAIYLARYTSAFLWLNKRSHHIVVSQGEATPLFPADFMLIHGCYHCMEVAYGRTDTRLSRMANLQKLSCQRARQVIAVSQKVKRDLVTYYQIPENKIIVQHNCVDTSRFHPFEKRPQQQHTLLFVGRLTNPKGLIFLKQLAAAIDQSTNWKLLIACNETPDTAFFEPFANITVKVGLNIDNIATAAYAQGDLLIVPSWFEGFELVTLEALSVGMPVIGTNVGAISELLDMAFPGVYLLPDITSPEATLLQYFDEVLADNSRSIDPETLHQRVTREFGIEQYFKKMDTILGPAFSRTS
ncbi:glycosyltransferase family 4 protein [Chitinophaga sp. RAB17]|uniref:glycosyltransferase family 4 protein n=1 Tax=Chitinophaga sp. RAB17 TaxID=3233049 RepID=UPI003F91D1C9